MMKPAAKTLVACLAIFFFTLVSAASGAGEFEALKKKLYEARDTLTTMIQDPGKRGADQQKLVKGSADAVSEALAEIKVPAEKQARFKVLTDTWAAFKKTREEELVPMLLAGEQDKAVKLASEVQAERFSKMLSLCDELGY